MRSNPKNYAPFMSGCARHAVFACSITAATLLPSGAFAQGTPKPADVQASPNDQKNPFGIEEVVVTARRREESAQNVPTAVSVISEDLIKKADITAVQELQYYVPSLNIQAQGNDYNYPPISIRGQGTYSPGATPAVVTYINEVPVPSTANAGDLAGGRFYDLENVQVLKGPQGTLFGRNTTGGALLFQSQRPTDQLEGYVEGTIGNYQQRDIDFALNLPIDTDHVLFRIAGQRLSRDGYAHVESTPSHPDGIDQGNRDILSFRGTLTLKADDDLKNDLIAEYHQQRTNGFPLVLAAVNPDGPAELFFDAQPLVAQQQAMGPNDLLPIGVDPFTKLNFMGLTDIFSYNLAKDVTFRNIASYSATTFSFQQDVDATIFPILDTPQVALSQSKQHQVTEEAQLQGTSFDNKLEWIGGFFYLDDHQPAFYDTQSDIFGGTSLTSTRASQSSTALYAQGTYDLSDFIEGLKFTAGYRYTWDTRSYASRDDIGAITTLPDAKFSAPSWTLGFDYHLDSDTLLYVTSRHGYRSGGYNPGSADPALIKFGPEFLTDLEGGVKADWTVAGMPVRTNADFYYGWYSDIQLTRLIVTPTGTNVVTSNAGKANVYGAEFEGFLNLTDDLQLTATASWYHEHFTELLGGVDPAIAHYFPKYVPAYQLNLGANYRLPLDRSVGDVTVSANWAWFSEISSSLEFVPQPFDTIPSYGTLNFNATWSRIMGHPLDASLYVTNVLDESHLTGSIPFYYGVGLTTATYTLPRMIGFRLRYTLEP